MKISLTKLFLQESHTVWQQICLIPHKNMVMTKYQISLSKTHTKYMELEGKKEERKELLDT